jgi:Protein of unknown function (DUF3040)
MHPSQSGRRVLRDMEREFRSSDPALVTLFGNFTRLADGEDLPRTERLRARAPGRSRCRPRLWMAFFFTVMLAVLCSVFAIAGAAHRHGPAVPRQYLSRDICTELLLWDLYLGQPAPRPMPALTC